LVHEKIGNMSSACSDWTEASVLDDEGFSVYRLADTDCRFVLGTPLPKNYDGECDDITNETDYLACLSRFDSSSSVENSTDSSSIKNSSDQANPILDLLVPTLLLVWFFIMSSFFRSDPS